MFLFSLILSLSAWAAPAALTPTAELVLGSVSYLGKTVRVGSQFFGKGELVTSDKSFLRIVVPKWSSAIVIGPKTSMELNFQTADQQNVKRYQLKNGICRWVSNLKSKDRKSSQVFTKSAAMGIRGTDFEISHDEKTEATKVVVFSGEVELKSEYDATSTLIKGGYWSAVGGAYGRSVKSAQKLSSQELEALKKGLQAHIGQEPNEREEVNY